MKTKYFLTHSEQAIPLVVVDETNYSCWLEQQAPKVQRWLQNTNFNPKNGTVSMIANDSGELMQVVLGLQHDQDYWAAGKLPAIIPAGNYKIDSTLAITKLPIFLLSFALQQYAFDRYKKIDNTIKSLVVPEQEFQLLAATLEAIFLIRDLINTPTQDMAPQHLADATQDLAKRYDGEFKQIVGDELLQAGFPAIHAVGRASANKPRLIELNWGQQQHPQVTLVGKGVCFDSGGLDLKSSANMRLMKKDMGGAAHVLGLASLIMQTKLPIRLRVLIAAVENSVSADSYRPGDIIQTHKGLSVEIDNTDAEGRLVLADALALACESEPELVIDIATLTGAARVALGTDLPALFASDDLLAAQLLQCGKQVKDPMWQLPIYEPYLEWIKPEIADLTNSAAMPYAGAIIAALFMQQFVTPSIPWFHLDLMAWNEKPRPGRPKGGEALAIRAIYQYLHQRYASK